MKTFKEHLAIIYDEHLIAEMSPKSNICDIPIGKLRSPLMKQMHNPYISHQRKVILIKRNCVSERYPSR